MNSKIVGIENEFFGQMVVDAIMAVKTFDDYGNATCARPQQPSRTHPWLRRLHALSGVPGANERPQTTPAATPQLPAQGDQRPQGARQVRQGERAARRVRPQHGPRGAGDGDERQGGAHRLPRREPPEDEDAVWGAGAQRANMGRRGRVPRSTGALQGLRRPGGER